LRAIPASALFGMCPFVVSLGIGWSAHFPKVGIVGEVGYFPTALDK
jgi:hypothetical protein